MYFNLLILDSNTNEKFNIAEISEQDWKFFIEDVALHISGAKRVRSIMSTVTLRNNKAKIKLAYEDSNYHEVVLNLDCFGLSAHNYTDKISKIWQEIMQARFGKEYSQELEANVAEASC